MPKIRINQAHIWYEDSGPGAETVVFSHGLLMNHSMFEAQVEALSGHYRCVSYDHRGQGRSQVTKSGYDMDSLTADAARLIRELDCGPCHFAGLSMGGFVGLRLAIHYPELLRSLTLIDTSASPEPSGSRLKYSLMVLAGTLAGFRPLVGRIEPLMFGSTFLSDPRRQHERRYWREHLAALERTGTLRAARGVIHRAGVDALLDRIDLPTLILLGEEDLATPLVRSERLRAGISGARLVRITGAGHSPTIEQAGKVSSAMLDFLRKLPGTSND